jgi:hypothetical protein
MARALRRFLYHTRRGKRIKISNHQRVDLSRINLLSKRQAADSLVVPLWRSEGRQGMEEDHGVRGSEGLWQRSHTAAILSSIRI